MVAVISGNGLGLANTSLSQIGSLPGGNTASVGQSKSSSYLNIATGNLLLQSPDAGLTMDGTPLSLVRTYNSLGQSSSSGSAPDAGWWSALRRNVTLTGTLDTAGSTVIRQGDDGSSVTYTYDTTSGRYLSSGQAGAQDVITWNAGTSSWTLTDGATHSSETYDASGRLVGLNNAVTGASFTLSYDAQGQLAQIADGTDTLTLSYDTNGRLSTIAMTDVPPGGSSAVTRTLVTYGYDAQGRLASVATSLAGDGTASATTYTTSYTYNTQGEIASVAQSDGSLTSYAYDTQGRVTTITVGTGLTASKTTFAYGLSGYSGDMATTLTDADGNVWTYAYDAEDRLAYVQSPKFSATYRTADDQPQSSDLITYKYDASGNLLTKYASGITATYNYDVTGDLIRYADPLGEVDYTYDNNHNVLTKTTYIVAATDSTSASGAMTAYNVYDGDGRPAFTIDPDGDVTQNVYNATGRLVTTRQFLSAVYPVAQQSPASPPSLADLNTWVGTQDLSHTARTDYTYDLRGQMSARTQWSAVDSNGNGVANISASYTTYVYDASGLLRQQTTLRGASRQTAETTTYSYDGIGRLLSATDPTGRQSSYVYDDTHGTIVIHQAGGLSTTEVFDSAGRLVTTTQQDTATGVARTSQDLYGSDGRLRVSFDAAGQPTYYFYNELGQVKATVDAQGNATEYLIRVSVFSIASQAGQIAYATKVDTSSWLSSSTGSPAIAALPQSWTAPATSSDDRTTLQLRDWHGNIIQTTDASSLSTSLIYDASDRFVHSVGPTHETSNFYDAAGRLVATINGDGDATTYAYDGAGNMVESVAYATNVLSVVEANGIPPSFATLQTKLVASPNDRVTRNYFDGDGNLLASVDPDGFVTASTYDETSHSVSTTRYSLALSAAQRASLTGQEPAATVVAMVASAGGQLSSASLDADNRIIQSVTPDGTTTTYGYDSAGNLKSTTVKPATGHGATTTTSASYDAFGETTSSTNTVGLSSTFAYDADGRLTSITDGLGNTSLSFYDTDGRLAYTIQGQPSGTTLNAKGDVTAYTYNAFGQVATKTQYSSQLTFGAGGFAIAASDTTAQISAWVNTLGSLASSPNSVTSFLYRPDGRLLSVTDALGYRTTYTYDQYKGTLTSSLIQVTDPGTDPSSANSEVSTYLWSPIGNLNESTSNGLTQSNGFDAFSQRTISDSNDGSNNIGWIRKFDGRGDVISSEQFGTGAMSYATYDAMSRTLSTTDGMGKVTQYAYNDTAGTTSVTTPDGVVMTTTTDAYGHTVSVTNGLGQTTTVLYGLDGRPSATVDAMGNAATTGYDADGNLIATVDADGRNVTYTYDANGHVLTRTVDPDGLKLVTSYQYDGQGRELSLTDSSGVLTTFTYDAVGNKLSQVVDAGAGGAKLTSTYTYDGLGNVLTATVGAGTANARTTQYVYDNDSPRRVIQTIVDPGAGHLNLTTSYTYDGAGHVLSTTDPRGNVTRNIYGEADEKYFTISPRGVVTAYWYDKDGRVIAAEAYATALTGVTLSDASTDTDVRIAVKNSPQDQITYTVYSAEGQPRFAIDGSGRVTESRYDAAGNLTETLRYAAPISITPSISSALYQGTLGEAAVTSALSQAGNSDATAEASATLYDADGRARFILSQNGVGTQAFVTELRYDNAGNVTDRIAYGSQLPVAPGTSLTSQFTLASVTSAVASMANEHSSVVYDAAGRPVFTIDATNHVTAQTYNAAGDVTEVAVYSDAIVRPATLTVATMTAALAGATPTQFQAMTYDGLGRIVSRSNALGVQQTYTYDASGLLASVTDHDGHTTSYTYDGAGRATLVESPPVSVGTYGTDGQLHTSIQHLYTSSTYDADGNLLTVSKGSGADAADITEVQTVTYAYDAAGNLTSTTASAPGSVDPTSGAFVPGGSTVTSSAQYDSFGHKVVQTDANGHSSYSAFDSQGHLAYSIDATGAVTAYAYDAFGNRISMSEYSTPLQVTTAGALPGWSPGQPFTQAMLDTITHSSSPNYVGTARVTTYAYDQRNQRISETDPSVSYAYSTGSVAGGSATASPITRYTYDGYGNLTSKSVLIQGVPGQTGNDTPVWATTFTYYDALNRATMVVDPMGYVTTSSYDGLGQLLSTHQYATAVPTASLSVTTPPAAPTAASTDRVAIYTYDAGGRETSQTRSGLFSDIGGVTGAAVGASVTTYTYDGENRVLTSTVNGATTTMTYDAAGRVASVAEPARQALVANWQSLLAANSSLDLTSASLYVSVSPTTSNVYDALGDLISSTVAAGNLQQTTRSYYDAWGRQVMQVDAEGNRTLNGYDSVGNLVSQSRTLTGGDGSTTQVTTTYAYDAVNRRIDARTSRTDGTIDSHETVTYDAFGEVVSRGDGTSSSGYTYDADGSLHSAVDAKTGATHAYLHDLAGRLVADISVAANDSQVESLNVLDLNGNILRQTAPGSTDTSNSATDPTVFRQFDRWGNVLSLTDADGNITTYQYDALNQVVKETEAGVLVVDDHGSRTVQNPTRQWFYDVDGRLLGTVDENGHAQSIVNDAAGKQVRMTDATNATSITAYDALGRQVASQNANGAITWQAYNGLNQVVARGDFGATVRGSAVTLQSYVLNQDGDRIRVLDALGHATTYVYDSQHRILKSQTALQAAASVADTYAYDVHGNTIRHTTALGDTATWTYDYYGRVQSHTDLSGATYTYTYDAGSGLLTQTTSTWKAPGQTDPAFLSTAITGANSSTTYSYYVDGKVKQATTSTGSDLYTYDADGNQTSDTIKTIDANGNAIHSEILTGFDSHGRIQTVTTENTDSGLGQMREIYTYDAAGNRRAVFVQSAFGTNASPINLNPGVPAAGTAIGPQLLEVSTPLVLTIPTTAFTDPMGVGLTYSATLAGGAPLPSWLTFDAGINSFTGTAPAGVTSYTIALTATDVLGRTVSTTFTLTLSTAKPTFSGTQAPVTVVNGTAFSFTVPAATDPNGAVTYAAVFWNGTAWVTPPAWVTFNAATRTFSGTAPTAGGYLFTVQATNSYGGFSNLSVTFNSTAHAPSYSGVAAPTPSAISGQGFSVTVPAASDDGPVTYSVVWWNGSAWVNPPSWATFNANTRVLSGTAQGAGSYIFAVEAVSSGGGATLQFSLTVNANIPPTFTGTPAAQSIGTGNAFAFGMPGATDPISGVTYYGYMVSGGSYVTLPSWVTFNAGNLTFSGTAPASAGTYQFAVLAYNAYGASSAESTTLTVTAPQPPAYSGTLSVPTNIYFNQDYSWGMRANTFTNPSGRALSYSISSSTTQYGTWHIDPNSGLISVSTVGTSRITVSISITVTATDPTTGLSASGQWWVNIKPSIGDSVAVASAKQLTASAATQPPVTPNVQAYWFTYDQDNRVVVDNGALLGDASGYHVGITASQGSASNTYDAAGNIKTYTTVNTSKVTSTQLNIYDNRNELVTVETPNSKGVVGVHETRSYDDDGRLVSDAYYNDAGSTGTGTYNGSTINVDTSGWLSSDIVNNYDADGNLIDKTDYAALSFQAQITASGAAVETGAYATAAKTLPAPPPTPPASASASNADGPLRESQGYQYGYSLEGDITSEENDTTTLNGQTASAIQYTMSYIKKDGYLASTTVATGNMGTTSNYYDNDGHLIATEAPQTSGSATYVVRASAVDASGDIVQRHVYAVDGSSSETDVYAYAAGHALGDVDEAGDFNVLASLTNFSNSDAGTTNYVVQVSDTLASIAQAVYGNASLAYIIAAANGLGTNGPAMLVAGSTLVIPQVLNATNTADTFRPYNPMAVLDTPTFQVPNALPVSPEPDDGKSSVDNNAAATPNANVGSAAASSASNGVARTESSLFRAAFIHPVTLLEIAPGDGDDYDHGSGGGAGDEGDGGYGGDDGGGYGGGGDDGGDGGGVDGGGSGNTGGVDNSGSQNGNGNTDGTGTTPDDPTDLPPTTVTVDLPPDPQGPPNFPEPPDNPLPPPRMDPPTPPPAPTWPAIPSAPAPAPPPYYIVPNSAPELQDPAAPPAPSAPSDPIINNYNSNYDSQRYNNLGDGAPGYGGNNAGVAEELAALRAGGSGSSAVTQPSNGIAAPSAGSSTPSSTAANAIGLPQDSSQLDFTLGKSVLDDATQLSDLFGGSTDYASVQGPSLAFAPYTSPQTEENTYATGPGFSSSFPFLSSDGISAGESYGASSSASWAFDPNQEALNNLLDGAAGMRLGSPDYLAAQQAILALTHAHAGLAIANSEAQGRAEEALKIAYLQDVQANGTGSISMTAGPTDAELRARQADLDQIAAFAGGPGTMAGYGAAQMQDPNNPALIEAYAQMGASLPLAFEPMAGNITSAEASGMQSGSAIPNVSRENYEASLEGNTSFINTWADGNVASVEDSPKLAQIQINAQNGATFQTRVANYGSDTFKNFVEEVSIRPFTDSDGSLANFRVRLDGVATEFDTSQFVLIDAKSSETAPLTPNQKIGYPFIGSYGGQVVGNGGNPHYPAGTVVPPTGVRIITPFDLPEEY